MIKKSHKSYRNAGGVVFAIIIGLASTAFPAMFGKTITVSPMLLFGIIILSNLPHYIKSKNHNDDDSGIFSSNFFENLAISSFLSILLIFIYKFAIALK
ncbi:hypothetical protein [Rugamonas sp. DEMB1]|uniref:hypothetical protein n=1 Tax=Rugamonas sp. DEMB1 TaxID=3039386 RepID=UPI00244859DA|nr:hypothetical protein [Rugamonas sp. DEMB1]WGG48627.1 hypothetical protein QC826_18375 [Rugamonas sp. DEMB1]